MIKWWVAGLVAAVAFGVSVWLSGALLLPQLMKSSADRWAVAVGFGLAVVALVALWGQSWAMQETRTAPGEDSSRRQGEVGPHVIAADERAIVAGGDISGIAATGDDATNIQHQ
jgi:hypothetical protein